MRIAIEESCASSQGGVYPPMVSQAPDYDRQLQEAVQRSLGDNPAAQLYDFESVDEKMRQPGVPVGLVNMGNSTTTSHLSAS